MGSFGLILLFLLWHQAPTPIVWLFWRCDMWLFLLLYFLYTQAVKSLQEIISPFLTSTKLFILLLFHALHPGILSPFYRQVYHLIFDIQIQRLNLHFLLKQSHQWDISVILWKNCLKIFNHRICFPSIRKFLHKYNLYRYFSVIHDWFTVPNIFDRK